MEGFWNDEGLSWLHSNLEIKNATIQGTLLELYWADYLGGRFDLIMVIGSNQFGDRFDPFMMMV